MPWYIEKDTGQERRRKAQGVCLTPHYGEDEAAANRAARKRAKNDPHGDTFVAVYLIPLDKKEEKLLLQKVQEERRRGSGAARMLMTMAAGLASGLDMPVTARGAPTVPPKSRGRWEHCSPDLLRARGPDFCATAARRGCLCGLHGSHDHWVRDDSEQGSDLEFEERPPFGEFLHNMGAAQKIDNGDGTITLVDGNGTPRLVVGKTLHDQVVAVDLESITSGELMRAVRRSTGSPADLGSLLLEAAQGGEVVVLPRVECGHPTPDGPCCRLQGHVSKTHWARMPVTSEAQEDEGPVDTGARVEREAERAAHTGSTTEVTSKASSTFVVGDMAFFEPKAYFDIHSSFPESMRRPVDPRFRLKGLGKKKKP